MSADQTIILPLIGDMLPRGDGTYVLRPRIPDQHGEVWVTIRDAARLMGVHVMTVYRLIDAGHLQVRRVSPHKTTISVRSLNEHIARGSDRENW